MGNTQAAVSSNHPSSGVAGKNISENAETAGDEETEMDESGLDFGSDTDFSHLFHVEDIHVIASTLGDVKKTVFECCCQELKEALRNRQNRTDIETLNFSRFCDVLKSMDLSHADLIQIFSLLDYEGRGSFDTVPVLQMLKRNKNITLNDDLNSVLERFNDCCWMPGFVDVYIDQRESFKQHGSNILDEILIASETEIHRKNIYKEFERFPRNTGMMDEEEFLLRNRFSSPAVNCCTIELFEVACKLRERIVESKIKSLEFPSLEDRTASLRAQTRPVLKKEDNVSGDYLLSEEVEKEELQQDKLQAGEALVLWFIQLVATTARAGLPLNPELLSTALTHTRTMVSRLLPLSLCHDSEKQPPFRNVECLSEMGSMIQLCPEKAELLECSLAFHLAHGSVSEILHCLTELNVSTVQIDCINLLSKIDQARKRLLQKNNRYIKMDLLGCDAKGAANQDPCSVLETNWKQSAFSTKPGETKVNFVFECSEWATFTKIKIKVDSEKSAPSCGFIFVLAEWSVGAESDLKKNLDRFSMYDNWTESSYKSQISERMLEGSHVTNDPVAYFSTKNRNAVDVVLDNPVIGKFIVVKFLEPRETGVDHLGIFGIKFYGVQITTGFGLLEQHVSRLVLTAKPLESNPTAIQAVLRFLLLVFCCQAKKKQAVAIDDLYHFSRKSYVTVDQKTGIVVYNPPGGQFKCVSTVMAKMPFSKDCPYFEIEIANSGQTGNISVGAAPRDLQSTLDLGMELQSYGYHANCGRFYVDGISHWDSTLTQCKTSDRMGCGVEFEGNKIKSIYFTKNGRRVHEYSSDVANPPGGLFPTFCMKFFGEKVRLVSKEPWRFNDKPVEKERTLVAQGGDFINPDHLDLSNVSIEKLWKTYKKFPGKIDQSLFLQLINSTLPYVKPGTNNFKDQTAMERTGHLTSDNKAKKLKSSASEIFDHLCYLLDRKNEIEEEDDIISRSAKDIIRDGLDLFFPCKEARPEILLDLLKESSVFGAVDVVLPRMELSLTGSKLILFQSLCHYFSTVNLDILMPLPTKPSHLPEDFNSSNLLNTLGKFLSISFRDSLGLFQTTPETDGSRVIRRSVSLGDETLSGRKKSEHLFRLLKLFNQLQVHLFAWVSQELSKPQEATDDVDRLEKLIIHYCCQLITPRAEHLLTRMKMLKDSDLRVLLLELNTSFLATTLRELVLLLSELATKLSSRNKAKLLENLKPVTMTIRKLLFKLPDLLPSLGENQGEKQMEKELRTWEVDSPLTNRPNIMSIMFSCVGATHFEVEFDKRCETEDSGEYLEFADSKGEYQFFYGQGGRATWQMKVRFEGTSAINFTYHRGSSSSSSAVYNFKVRAMQTKVSDFHWLYDLYLSFCHLFGRISASVLDKKPVLPKSATLQGKLEMQMYQSELWTTIFRGGLVAKKFERSLSGNYETADQSDVAKFLHAVTEFNSEKAKAFIDRCKSHHNGNHSIGGEEIDRVIASVFAALLWHTQSLRHDVNIYLCNDFDGKISDGISEAYSAAETLRLFLAEQRQTIRKEHEEQHEIGEEEEVKENKAAVDIVRLVEEKSKFLLEFAGLSRVALKAEEFKRKFETRRSHQQSINRHLSHEPSVDLSISVESKYPSFRLVFDFVQDVAWTKDKVEDLLKKRYINSESLWKTYSFMSEFFRTISSEHLENDMSCTVFMRALLASQDKFGRHYADGIDGCGLGMEANVRSSYYGLLRQLVTLLRKNMKALSKPVESEVLATCVLHLLDIDWQAYDLPFLVELRLPELYFTLAKDCLPPVFEEPKKEFGVDETEEEYRWNLEYAREESRGNRIRANFWLWNHIRARFKKLGFPGFGTSFRCEGCRCFYSRDCYRCLDCNDVNICKMCYEKEKIPLHEDHSGEHSLILFRYLCKGCMGFIIASRWHCNECNDFDLCNGCHNSHNFPQGSSHNADHDVSKIPTPIVHQSKKLTIKDPVNVYFHLHSWMLFSTTALSSLDFLKRKASEEKVQRVDENYLYSACQLYSSCVERAIEYLVHESSTNEVDSDQSISSSATATQSKHSVKASELNEESLMSKIIGLIAALIPPNNQNPAVKEVTEVLLSEKFLMALFNIASAKKVHDVVTRHMALGLLGKLLQQMNISSEASQSLKSSDSGEMMIVDPKAMNLVQNLFDFGADCLKRHGLELAKSTSQLLNELQMNPIWTQLLTHQFSATVDLLHSSTTLSSIFALFAFTGFPEVLTTGTLVTHVAKDKEVIESVVRLKKSDEATCTIVELTSRKKKRMKDTLLDVVTNKKSFLTEYQVSQFIKLIIDIVNQKVIPGSAVDALRLWQLALVIKASLQSVHFNQSKVNLQLYENTFLQCLSHLASLGTGLSKSLLLRDLEILSLELNKHSQTEPGPTAESEVVTMAAGEDTAVDNNDNGDEDIDGSVAFSSSEDEDDHELRHQSVGSEEMIFVMTTEEDATKENIGDTILRDTEHMKKKRCQTRQKKGEIDTGVEIGRYISDLLHAEIEIDECIEESNPENPCLISTSGDEDEEMVRKQKEKSSGLVEKLLSSKEKGLLTKVNRALAVLYARKLLVALVSECPEDKAVEFFTTGTLPECKHITSIFFILPLLVGLEADRTLEKVIVKVVNCCQPDDIVSIAVASSFFVAATEGQLVTVSKHLPPPLLLKNDENAGFSSHSFMDEVYIPGATALKVELDKSPVEIFLSRIISDSTHVLHIKGKLIANPSKSARDQHYGLEVLRLNFSSLRTGCDVELAFSSSPDLTKYKQCFSGRSSENWEDFTIEGDHLYCTLTGPDVTLMSSSYQFKVTGVVSLSGHFDVGYLALSAICDKPETARLLPFGRLWKLLVGMVNRSAKTQRLKAIRLLLKLLSLQFKSRECEELSVDLSLLKGLWQMYQKMMEVTKDSTEVQPALVLALTELFYIAQNVAKEWNSVHSFITSVEADGSAVQE